jgi:antitoxin MazE
VKARIVRIGNSQGVRIPKPLLEEAQLGDEVELRAEAGRIVIERADAPRAGWSEAFAAMAAAGDDALLDEATPTAFDEAEWTW